MAISTSSDLARAIAFIDASRKAGLPSSSPLPGKAEIIPAYENEYVAGTYHEGEFAGPEWWREASSAYTVSASMVPNAERLHRQRPSRGLRLGMGPFGRHDAARRLRVRVGSNCRSAWLRMHSSAALPIEQGDFGTLIGLEGRFAAITMQAVFRTPDRLHRDLIYHPRLTQGRWTFRHATSDRKPRTFFFQISSDLETSKKNYPIWPAP